MWNCTLNSFRRWSPLCGWHALNNRHQVSRRHQQLPTSTRFCILPRKQLFCIAQLQRKKILRRKKSFREASDLRQQAREVWVENGPFFLIWEGGEEQFLDLFKGYVVFCIWKVHFKHGLGCWEWRPSNQYMLHGPSQSRQSIVLNKYPSIKREIICRSQNVRFSQKVEFAQNICLLKSGRQ